jgi:hypothetical protein
VRPGPMLASRSASRKRATDTGPRSDASQLPLMAAVGPGKPSSRTPADDPGASGVSSAGDALAQAPSEWTFPLWFFIPASAAMRAPQCEERR